MLLLFFMGAALLKLSVDGPLTTSNRNQLVLVVAMEGICHRIKEHVLDARRGNAASLPRHLCHSLALLWTMDCFVFSVRSRAFTACRQGEMSLSLREQHPSFPLKMCCACLESFSTDCQRERTQLARSYQLQWLVAPRLPTQTHVPDPTLVLDQT